MNSNYQLRALPVIDYSKFFGSARIFRKRRKKTAKSSFDKHIFRAGQSPHSSKKSYKVVRRVDDKTPRPSPSVTFASPHSALGATNLLTPHRTEANQTLFQNLQQLATTYRKVWTTYGFDAISFYEFLKKMHPNLTFRDAKRFVDLSKSYYSLKKNHEISRGIVKELIIAAQSREVEQKTLDLCFTNLESTFATNFKNLQIFISRLICFLNEEPDRSVHPSAFHNALKVALANINEKNTTYAMEKQKKIDAVISEPYLKLIIAKRQEIGLQWLTDLIYYYCPYPEKISAHALAEWFDLQAEQVDTLPESQKSVILSAMEKIGAWYDPGSKNSVSGRFRGLALEVHLKMYCGLTEDFDYPLVSTEAQITNEMRGRYTRLQSNQSLEQFIEQTQHYFSEEKEGWIGTCPGLREDAYLIYALSFPDHLDQNIVALAKKNAERIVSHLYTHELPFKDLHDRDI